MWVNVAPSMQFWLKGFPHAKAFKGGKISYAKLVFNWKYARWSSLVSFVCIFNLCFVRKVDAALFYEIVLEVLFSLLILLFIILT